MSAFTSPLTPDLTHRLWLILRNKTWATRRRRPGLSGKWTGHSLRRRFATAARCAGAHLERIGRHGGWADNSTALLGYVEDADRWTDNPVTGL
jgi:hypothetical protein